MSGLLPPPQRTRRPFYRNKTKMKAVIILAMAIMGCLIVFAMADASPLEPTSTTTEAEMTSTTDMTTERSYNNSKLYITHVIKTIEFEVDVVEDDGLDNETETATAIQTDLKLLNPILLQKLVALALNSTDATEATLTLTQVPET